MQLAAAVADDQYEENDSLVAAANLGTLSAVKTISNLVMADSQDWFRFTMSGAGTTSDYVSIQFTHSQGDLDLAVYNSSGQRVRVSEGTVNNERVSLNGLAAGAYYVKVLGYRGVSNPNYALTIDPGIKIVNPPPTSGSKSICNM